MLWIGFILYQAFTKFTEIFVEKSNVLNPDSLNLDPEISLDPLVNPDFTVTGTRYVKNCLRQKKLRFSCFEEFSGGLEAWSLDVLFSGDLIMILCSQYGTRYQAS
jgi:hypothetical protein